MAKKQTMPAMPFNTTDWLLNPAIKSLSTDVKGLYVDLLCFMWESPVRGVMVKPNMEAYTRDEIKLVMCTGSDAWIDQLVRCGLVSMRGDGAIFSPQIVRDEEIRSIRREAGKKGGEKTKARILSGRHTTKASVPVQETVSETPPPMTAEQKAKAEKAKKYKYAEFVTLTRDEYAKLCAEYGEDPAKSMIEILNNYKGSRGKRYKSDYLTIRGWVKDKYFENIQRYGTSKINGGACTSVASTGQSGYTDTL